MIQGAYCWVGGMPGGGGGFKLAGVQMFSDDIYIGLYVCIRIGINNVDFCRFWVFNFLKTMYCIKS